MTGDRVAVQVFRPSAEKRVRITVGGVVPEYYRIDLDTGFDSPSWVMLTTAENLAEARRMETIVVAAIGAEVDRQRKAAQAAYERKASS